MSDDDYVELVDRLDRAIQGVDRKGFAVTPFEPQPALASRLGFEEPGGVWVKDETGNVSGSHKGRHLFGLVLHLEVVERIGLSGADARPPLAIASCGNAALAAAVVARAGDRHLQVFVPTDADPLVVTRLKELEADVVACERDPEVPGDPTVRALGRATAGGAIPFTCQGNENGLSIEGGLTLGYEMAARLAAADAHLDRAMVQVGGGALATAVLQGFREAVEMGAAPSVPAVHAIQTQGAHPLERAFRRVMARAAETSVEEALAFAVTHRSAFMIPWDEPPRSIAHGIIDDETYDWAAVVRGMIDTGGWPVLTGEATLEEANELAAAATGIQADPTGTSGLAGLLTMLRDGGVGGEERVGVLFTGVRRQAPDGNHESA
jgi:threonine synthase